MEERNQNCQIGREKKNFWGSKFNWLPKPPSHANITRKERVSLLGKSNVYTVNKVKAKVH